MRRLHPHRLPVQGRRKAGSRRARRRARGQKARPQDEKDHPQHEKARCRSRAFRRAGADAGTRTRAGTEKPNIGEIHNLLHIASEKYQDADGFVNVSSSGLYIKRVKPDFNVRAYGYSKLPELLAAFPNKYQIKRYEGKGGATIIAYKCL